MPSRALWHRTVVVLLGLILGLGRVGAIGAADLSARVRNVVDGDTVVLQAGQRLRYLGINAPERGEAFADEATRRNRRLVRGREVKLEFDAEREDRYGRLLAYVWADGEMVNETLLREGLAHVFVIPPNLRYYHRFLAIQEEARRRRVGLWGPGGLPGPLKITHLEAVAPGGERRDLNGEVVRIANVTGHPVDLAGYRIQNDRGRTYVFPQVVLRPGYALTLYSGRGHDRTTDGGPIKLYWAANRPVWRNRGDTATLLDPRGHVVHTFAWRPKKAARNQH